MKKPISKKEDKIESIGAFALTALSLFSFVAPMVGIWEAGAAAAWSSRFAFGSSSLSMIQSFRSSRSINFQQGMSLLQTAATAMALPSVGRLIGNNPAAVEILRRGLLGFQTTLAGITLARSAQELSSLRSSTELLNSEEGKKQITATSVELGTSVVGLLLGGVGVREEFFRGGGENEFETSRGEYPASHFSRGSSGEGSVRTNLFVSPRGSPRGSPPLPSPLRTPSGKVSFADPHTPFSSFSPRSSPSPHLSPVGENVSPTVGVMPRTPPPSEGATPRSPQTPPFSPLFSRENIPPEIHIPSSPRWRSGSEEPFLSPPPTTGRMRTPYSLMTDTMTYYSARGTRFYNEAIRERGFLGVQRLSIGLEITKNVGEVVQKGVTADW